jgi:hypothetical protein
MRRAIDVSTAFDVSMWKGDRLACGLNSSTGCGMDTGSGFVP